MLTLNEIVALDATIKKYARPYTPKTTTQPPRNGMHQLLDVLFWPSYSDIRRTNHIDYWAGRCEAWRIWRNI